MYIKIIISKFLNVIRDVRFIIKKINCSRRALIGKKAIVYPEVKISNMTKQREKIKIGKESQIRCELICYPNGGTIEIGDRCYIGDLTRIRSMGKIKIGNDVLIAHNVNIHDNNSHSINLSTRKTELSYITKYGYPKENIFSVSIKDIVIEDNVWIGFNAVILKGVTIGEGAIIAAGSIVTKDVKPFTMVAGNPATFVKNLK